MRRFLRIAAIVLGALGACGLRTGTAFAAPPVRLSLQGCEHLASGEVERILLLELGSKRANEASVLVTEVTVECGPVRSVITVQDPITRKLLRRSIPNASAEVEGQARLLALAASELLLASWAELESNPHPQVEPEGTVPSGNDIDDARAAVRAMRARGVNRGIVSGGATDDALLVFDTEQDDTDASADADEEQQTRPTAKERKRQETNASGLRVLAVASGRGILGVPGMLYGGGVRTGRDRYGIVAWTLDALLEGGTVEVGDATVSLTAVTAGGIVGFSFKANLVSLRAGGGLRWGLTAVQEDVVGAENPSSITVGPWGWPVLSASVTLHTNDGPLVEMGTEAGYAVIPVGGTSSAVGAPALRGAWMGASFGIGFGPPN